MRQIKRLIIVLGEKRVLSRPLNTAERRKRRLEKAPRPPHSQLSHHRKRRTLWTLVVSMATPFLQANIGHPARAQDLLVQSMAEWSIQIAIVTEPYFVPSRDNWVGDHDDLVTFIRAADSPLFEKVVKGRGYVLIVTNTIAVIGCTSRQTGASLTLNKCSWMLVLLLGRHT